MNAPDVTCTIGITCAVHTSESPDKIKTAITNIFPDCTIRYQIHTMTASASGIQSLERLREFIQSRRSQKIYRRILQRHVLKDSTWFYLNKQAAFVNKIAICENGDESPLGPIRVTLVSQSIENIIQWLVYIKSD